MPKRKLNGEIAARKAAKRLIRRMDEWEKDDLLFDMLYSKSLYDTWRKELKALARRSY